LEFFPCTPNNKFCIFENVESDVHSLPTKRIIGLDATAFFGPGIASIDSKSSTPNSTRSRLCPSYVLPYAEKYTDHAQNNNNNTYPLTRTKLFGLFFECEPSAINEQSFLLHKNSSELASSKGRISLSRCSVLQLGFESLACRA